MVFIERKKELLKVCENIDDNLKSIIIPMIDDLVFLENTLSDLKKLPFIKIHPRDPALQKPTPASKQYKELLQQYNNCVKILCGVIGKKEGGDITELQKGLKMLNEKYT